jgi:cytochrome d ubiquinol oxidase subunit II
MPTTLADGASLTTSNASATEYTLQIMTVVAVVFTPVVLMYQGWTYWVFRRRIAVHHIPEPAAEPAVGR